MTTIRGKAKDLVDLQHGTISREIFVSKELYAQEQERVFARAWLFVGHVSQIPKPGDFFVSRMGEESVILCRDRQGEVHVFLNTCRHRGMKVCRYDEGNTPVFSCPYHGWSYATDGKLVGVPHFKTAYHEQLDKTQWGLIPVAQMANYRGTIWANWDPDAPPFEEYLGSIRPQVDIFFDGPDGVEHEIEVLGVLRWTIPCNWKFGAENFTGDNYHGPPTHRSVDMLSISPSGQRGRHTGDHIRRPGVNANIADKGHGWRTYGMQLDDDYPYTPSYPNNPIAEAYYREGYEQRKRTLGERARVQGGGGNIFPNTTLGTGQSVAVWHPQGPDSTEVWRFIWVHKDAPPETKEMLRRYIMRYGGPAGMTEQDDMENWNYAHQASKGTIARRYPYNYAMGLGHEASAGMYGWLTERGGLISETHYTEQNQRGMYARWAQFMDAESWDDLKAADRR